MTETSYFWTSGTTGDQQAEWTDDELALFLDVLFNYDRSVPLIAFQEYSLYSDPCDANAGNFRLSACCALVDGRIYINDATLTLVPANGNGHYAIVLRRDDSGGAGDQTVRADLIYSPFVTPTPTQTAATWECVVARGQVAAGVAQIDSYHWRPFPHNTVMPVRRGSDEDDWTEGDEDAFTKINKLYQAYNTTFQCGVKAFTAVSGENTIAVDFPRSFKIGTKPLVFCTPYNLSGNVPTPAYIPILTRITAGGFELNFDDDTNVEGFHWIAVGHDNVIEG